MVNNIRKNVEKYFERMSKITSKNGRKLLEMNNDCKNY